MGIIDGFELTRRWAEPNNVPLEFLLLRLGYWADAGAFGSPGFVDRFGLPLDNNRNSRGTLLGSNVLARHNILWITLWISGIGALGRVEICDLRPKRSSPYA